GAPRYRPRSREEQALAPTLAFAHEQAALVQAVRPITPELDPLRLHPIALPVRRPRHLAALVIERRRLVARLEQCAAFEGTRLVRGPGAGLRGARARREIGVGLLVRYRLHRTFDPHLPAQRLPVEQQGRARIFAELSALAAAA